jgi:type II secretory pathway predicted ATPase ExeA
VGQPELLQLMNSTELRQFKQRVSLHFHLKAMARDDIESFIDHRLKISGYQGKRLFDDGAIGEIYEFSEGIPRLVNAICDRALIKACVSNQRKVDKKLIRKVT